MFGVQRLRERLSLVVVILLFVLAPMTIGVACACATDHPMQSVERVIASASPAPAVVAIWTYTFAAFATLLIVRLVGPQRHRPLERASPADLQRFLF